MTNANENQYHHGIYKEKKKHMIFSDVTILCIYNTFLKMTSVFITLINKSKFFIQIVKIDIYCSMFEKGHMKNLTKLKNRLELESNRPSFLEDENYGFYKKP